MPVAEVQRGALREEEAQAIEVEETGRRGIHRHQEGQAGRLAPDSAQAAQEVLQLTLPGKAIGPLQFLEGLILGLHGLAEEDPVEQGLAAGGELGARVEAGMQQESGAGKAT